MLSGRGLCDELITRPEESYRLWCVVVCDLENLKNKEAMTRVGSQRHRKEKKKHISYTRNIVYHVGFINFTMILFNFVPQRLLGLKSETHFSHPIPPLFTVLGLKFKSIVVKTNGNYGLKKALNRGAVSLSFHICHP